MEKTLKYSKKLIGIKYKWWKPEIDGDEYFALDKDYTIDELKEKGIGCTGFVNLVYKFHNDGYFPDEGKKGRGGTGWWYRYLKKHDALEEFDYEKDYPTGTLFLRKYKNIEDQGHVAILTKKTDRLLYSKIQHSYADDSMEEGGINALTMLGYSHFYLPMWSKKGYYEYASLPEKWLKKY